MGALIGLPESADVKAALEWAAAEDRFVVSLCHGPAAFLAVGDSDTPIPVHFAVATRSDLNVPQEGVLGYSLRDIFDVEVPVGVIARAQPPLNRKVEPSPVLVLSATWT